jgi:hypothetical protein
MMTSLGARDHACLMSETPAPSTRARVVVRVLPRLLGDLLTEALREAGLDVVCLHDERTSVIALDCRFDLAIVSEELAGDFIASPVLVLDPSGVPVSTSGELHDRVVGIGEETAAFVRLVHRLLRQPSVNADFGEAG